MAQGMYFKPASFTAAQYDVIDRKLEEAGVREPKGRLYHVSFGTGDQLQVFDVWDSQESFDAFGAVLMPILQAEGIDPGAPVVGPIHNILTG